MFQSILSDIVYQSLLSVADYSIRIENLLRKATRSRIISDEIRNEMLCSKLWNGLGDPLLKTLAGILMKQKKI